MYEMYEIYEILVAQKRFLSPPTVSTYDKVNSSALQATAVCGAHGRVVVNNAKSVINDMTNLNEGLPVINNTNTKMTCVVVLSINSSMTYVVDDLCGQSLMWSNYTLEISSALISIYVLSTCRGMRLSFLKRHWMAWSLSGWLDAIEYVPPLCRRQPCYWYWSGLLAR